MTVPIINSDIAPDAGQVLSVEPPEPKGDITNPPESGSKPPWGSVEEFDPDRAWKRIQAQKTELDEFRSKAAADQKAKKSDLERLAAERDETAKARDTGRAELWAIGAAIKCGLDLEDVEYLKGTTTWSRTVVTAAVKVTPALSTPVKPTPTVTHNRLTATKHAGQPPIGL